ncbi:MAG: nitroreductase family protein [Thermodesulfobacteriota bacterium]
MIETLRKRRSIRAYHRDRPITPEHLDILKEALLRSPSSREIRPWSFVLVQDRGLLGKLSRAKPHGAGFLKDAALGIVVCGDSTQSDVWIEDCAIAAVIAHLAAASIGLGSCWVQIRQRHHDEHLTAEQYVQRLLSLPEHVRVLSIIAVGHAAEDLPGVPVDDLPTDKFTSR